MAVNGKVSSDLGPVLCFHLSSAQVQYTIWTLMVCPELFCFSRLQRLTGDHRARGERKCDNLSIGNIGGPVSDHVARVSNHHSKMEGGRYGGPKTVPKGGPVTCVFAKQYKNTAIIFLISDV